jgi:hypothetical protein
MGAALEMESVPVLLLGLGETVLLAIKIFMENLVTFLALNRTVQDMDTVLEMMAAAGALNKDPD